MSIFKTTFSRALPVISGPNAVIPTPNVLTSGFTSDFAVGNNMIDSNKNFIELGIKVGDVVYNMSSKESATIISISEIELGLNSSTLSSDGNYYIIYQQSAASGIGNQGCYLYVDIATNLTVITIGGDETTFVGVQGGTILPVQVIQVLESTAAENLIALW